MTTSAPTPTPLLSALQRADRIRTERTEGAAATPIAHDLVILADEVLALRAGCPTPDTSEDQRELDELEKLIDSYGPAILSPETEQPRRMLRALVDDVERIARARAAKAVFACANAVSAGRPK